MTRRSISLLLALAVALGIGGLWVGLELLSGSDDGHEAIGAGDVAPLSRGGGGTPTELVELSDDPDEARQTGPDASSDDDPGRSQLAQRKHWKVPTDAVWIDGRVELPPGTPLDEELVVVAEGRRFVASLESSRRNRARVANDGTFKVAFSKETKSGKLMLEARYLYLPKSESVKPNLVTEPVVLEPKLGGKIVARVLPPRTEAFREDAYDGLEVTCDTGWSIGSRVQREGKLVAEGTFELGGIPEDTGVTVAAISPLFADGKTLDVDVPAGGTTNVDVELSIGVRLSGSVVDEGGRPLLGASVAVMTAAQAGRRNPFFNMEEKRLPCEPDGKFSFPGVPPGDLVVIGFVDDYLDTQVELGELVDGDERSGVRVVMNRGGVVAGVVFWPGGKPADGATVRISQQLGMSGFDFERPKGTTVTGPDGRFEFGALEEGACGITASAPDPADAERELSLIERKFGSKTPAWTVYKEDIEPGSMNLVLNLAPGNDLAGVVVDDQGEPVDTFRVAATPVGNNILSASSKKTVKERFDDPRGRFVLEGLQPGEWTVKVTAIGHGEPERQTVSIPWSGGKLRFVAPRAGSVAGTVFDPKGKPVTDARVIVEHGGKNSAVSSGSEGKYAVDKVMPGWVEVKAEGDGFGPSEPVKFEMSAAGERTGVVLYLAAGATIAGVLHPSIEDREGRSIGFRSQGGEPSFGGGAGARGRMNIRTDDGGAFEITGLAAGTYELTLEPRGGPDFRSAGGWALRSAQQKRASVELGAGDVAHVVLGEPSPTEILVTGKVTKGGEPVPGRVVSAHGLDEEDITTAGAGRTEEDGSFDFRLDGPGEYRFVVRGEGRSQVTFTESISEGTTEVEYDFEIPTFRIFGIVNGPDGTPKENVRLTMSDSVDPGGATSAWLGTHNATTDENGAYEFQGLSKGTYVMRSGGARGFGFGGAGEAEYGRFVQSGIEVDKEDGELELNVRLRRPGTIEGTVTDSSGLPVGGARIHVVDESGAALFVFSRVRSAADGTFSYAGVGPGKYEVYAERRGVTGERRKVKVFEDGVAETPLSL